MHSPILTFEELKIGRVYIVAHYANMSVQYTAIFHVCKNDNFQMFFLYFSYFSSKHRLWVNVSEAVLSRTHNLCFGAKIRKNVYPCKPQFYYIKVGCKGVFVTRTCFRDDVKGKLNCYR